MGSKLTNEQEAMLSSCLALDAAWVTGASGENKALLDGWVSRGWAEEVAPPAGLKTFSAYKLTAAGRAALSQRTP